MKMMRKANIIIIKIVVKYPISVAVVRMSRSVKKIETEIESCFFPCLNGNQNAKAIKIIKVDIMIKYVTTNF